MIHLIYSVWVVATACKKAKHKQIAKTWHGLCRRKSNDELKIDMQLNEQANDDKRPVKWRDEKSHVLKYYAINWKWELLRS